MKFTINRAKPTIPPVTDVTVTLSRADLVGMLRVLGRAYDADTDRVLPNELNHGITATKTMGLFTALTAAAKDAGLVNPNDGVSIFSLSDSPLGKLRY